jgi:hypothetical protein
LFVLFIFTSLAAARAGSNKGGLTMDGAVELLRLFERRSAAGTTYFVGALGGAKVLMMKDTRADLTDGTLGIWQVYLKPRDAARTDRASQKRAPSPRPAPEKPIVAPPVRARARPAQDKPSTARAKAIADINERYAHVTLNDEIDL